MLLVRFCGLNKAFCLATHIEGLGIAGGSRCIKLRSPTSWGLLSLVKRMSGCWVQALEPEEANADASV